MRGPGWTAEGRLAMANSRVFVFKAILWCLAGLAAAVAVLRFAMGLGVATALSDSTPWGLWVGFDVMGGVALAAGGFVMAAVVHIFHLDKYHAAARPAILTAFLGYGAVAVGLLFDLGLPWNIWHMIIFWNPRSPLFEVGWCVMLYLTVLALEVAPVILERTPFQRAYRFFVRLALPIMILGIMLSTLHQSSLGSLLLIMPFRIYPLWYTHLLPEIFFISAICLGLSMVMFESSITSWLYRRKPEMEMLGGLAKMASGALGFYFVVRMADIAYQNKLGLIFSGNWEGNIFILEMLLSTVLPMVLYLLPAVRRSPTGLWLISMGSVLGFVFNRINASGLSQIWATKSFYFPAWTEISISVGIVSACGLVFFFIQEHFPVDPHGLKDIEEERARSEKGSPAFSPFTQVWLGEGWRKAARVYSMCFVLAMALGLTLTPKGQPAELRPVTRARGAGVLKIAAGPQPVYFDHKRHQDEGGKEKSCGTCHHLHLPGDKGTPCSECHRFLFTPATLFDHDRHAKGARGGDSCSKCHGPGEPQSLTVAKTCQDCHRKDMMVAGNPVAASFKKPVAGSYKEAMHKMCIPCHVTKAADPAVNLPNLGRCGACHDSGTVSEKAYRIEVPVPQEEEGRI
jgi:Ni/Fe-hydrogenase subunit HybB-like protein